MTCLWCNQHHPGQACKQNLIVCCKCYTLVPKQQLTRRDGVRWNICKECELDVADSIIIPYPKTDN